MKKPIYLSLVFIVIFLFDVQAQSKLPIIKANSEMVNIREGKDFHENAWSIAPEANPDVYTSSNAGESVTFYTDIDSISFVVDKEKVHDFIILLNKKDTAYTQIKYAPSYLDILKGAATFDDTDHYKIPKFTYQDSSAQALKTLRKALNLDSIAGSGNEVSRIINLMHWMHDFIPHDGNHENPVVKNAMSLIKECKQERRGLNCRGLGIVLNECYLALGFKSRFVTCMPKDSIFNDCHVINMVYSQDLEKWIWVDPTNDAYVLDEKGMLLGFNEVRERLIQDKTLIINPDANWNNRFSVIKENYLYEYMAKNLYRFECPLRSEYNLETRSKGQVVEYVELIPLDGYNKTPKTVTSKSEKLDMTFKNYRTTNPSIFWAKPE